jgi:hypothetical protein
MDPSQPVLTELPPHIEAIRRELNSPSPSDLTSLLAETDERIAGILHQLSKLNDELQKHTEIRDWLCSRRRHSRIEEYTRSASQASDRSASEEHDSEELNVAPSSSPTVVQKQAPGYIPHIERTMSDDTIYTESPPSPPPTTMLSPPPAANRLFAGHTPMLSIMSPEMATGTAGSITPTQPSLAAILAAVGAESTQLERVPEANDEDFLPMKEPLNAHSEGFTESLQQRLQEIADQQRKEEGDELSPGADARSVVSNEEAKSPPLTAVMGIEAVPSQETLDGVALRKVRSLNLGAPLGHLR